MTQMFTLIAYDLRSQLRERGTIALVPRFEIEPVMEAIERHRCTSAYLMPTMVKALVASHDFSREKTRSLRTGLTIVYPPSERRRASRAACQGVPATARDGDADCRLLDPRQASSGESEQDGGVRGRPRISEW